MIGLTSPQRDVFSTRTITDRYCYGYNGGTKKRSEAELAELSELSEIERNHTAKRSESEVTEFLESSEVEDDKNNRKFDKDPKVRRQAEAEELLAPLEIPNKLPPEWFEMNGIKQQDADESYDFFVTEIKEINKIWKERKSSF
jgi:hypothetical protein